MRLRWFLILTVGLLGCDVASVAPDAGLPEASSLRACDFDGGCDPGEICDISQSCGPAPDGGADCGPIQGSLQCHRNCSEDHLCAVGEVCVSHVLFDRTDYATGATYFCQ